MGNGHPNTQGLREKLLSFSFKTQFFNLGFAEQSEIIYNSFFCKFGNVVAHPNTHVDLRFKNDVVAQRFF